MPSTRSWLDRHPLLGFVLAFAAFLPVLFVGQCLLRGWSHWGGALVSTLLSGVAIGALQFFLVLRPQLLARVEGEWSPMPQHPDPLHRRADTLLALSPVVLLCGAFLVVMYLRGGWGSFGSAAWGVACPILGVVLGLWIRRFRARRRSEGASRVGEP